MPVEAEKTRTLRTLYYELGRALVEHGRYPQAEEALQQALCEEGDVSSAAAIRHHLGRMFEGRGQKLEAFRAYAQAASEYPSDAGAHLDDAHRLLTKRFARQEADGILSAWSSVDLSGIDDEDRSEIAFFLGRVSQYAGRLTESQTYFLEAAHLRPGDARILEGLGETQRLLGSHDEALKSLTSAHQLALAGNANGRLPFIRLRLAHVLASKGLVDEALRLVDRLDHEPIAREIRVLRARLLVAKGRYDDGLAELEAGGSPPAATADEHLVRAQAMTGLHRYADAVTEANLALQRDPDNPEAAFAKLQALLEDHLDVDQAVHLLTRRYLEHEDGLNALRNHLSGPLVTTRLNDGNVHLFLATVYLHAHDRWGSASPWTEHDVMTELDSALELGLSDDDLSSEAGAYELKGTLLERRRDPEGAADAYFLGGRRRYWSGDYGWASELLQKGVSLDPERVDIHWYLADSLHLQSYGERSRRRELLEEARGTWEAGASHRLPTSDDAWAYVVAAYISEGLAPLQRNQTDEYWKAVVFLERAFALVAATAPWLSALARQFRSLEMEEMALKVLGQALLEDPQNVGLLEEKAAALANIGRYEEGLAVIEQRLSIEQATWALSVKAFLLNGLGDYEGALECMERPMAEDPTDLWYVTTRSYALLGARRFDEALEDYRRTLEVFDTDPASMSSIDLEYAAKAAFFVGAAGDPTLLDLSESLSRQILSGDTNTNSNVPCQLALIQLLRGDVDEALRQYDVGLEAAVRAPEMDVLLNLELPFVEYVLDDADERQRALRDLRARAEECQTHLVSRTVDEEIRIEAASDGADDPWRSAGVELARARRCLILGLHADAVRHYASLLGSPVFPEALEAIGGILNRLIHEGDEHLKAERADPARAAYESALDAVAPARRPDIIARLGMATFLRGAEDEATDYFVRAMEGEGASAGTILGATCRELVSSPEVYWMLDAAWERAAGAQSDAFLSRGFQDARDALCTYLDAAFGLDAPGEPHLLFVTPIALELDSALYAEYELEVGLSEHRFSDLQEKIRRRFGVRTPSVRVSQNEALTYGQYVIKLDENTLHEGTGVAYPTLLFTTANRHQLEALGIPPEAIYDARNPRSGRVGAWIGPEHIVAAEQAHFEVWSSPLEYVAAHVEEVVCGSLAVFLDIQEVENLISEWRVAQPGLVETALAAVGSRYRFARLLQALVEEEIPIADPQRVLRALSRLKDGRARRRSEKWQDRDFEEALRILRYELRDTLPANSDEVDLVHLPYEVEAEFERWLHTDMGTTTVAMPPDVTQSVVGHLRKLLDSALGKRALVVKQAALRTFVRRLARMELPVAQVVSEDEVAVKTGVLAAPQAAVTENGYDKIV